MSSSGFLHSLDIDRPYCWRVPLLVSLGAVLGLLVVSLGALPWQARVMVAILTLAGGFWEVRRHWPGSTGYVARIRVPGQGDIFHLAGALDPQAWVPADLVHWWVLPRLAVGVALIDRTGQRHEAILFRDCLPSGVWRRLLVRLKYGVRPAVTLGARSIT